MLRRLFTSVLSLVLCAASVVLWVRSYFVSEHAAHAAAGGSAWVARSARGVIYLDHRSNWDYELGWSWGRRRIRPREDALAATYQNPSRGAKLFGFGLFSGTAYTWPGHLYPGVRAPLNRTDPRWLRDRYTSVCFPHWAALLAFAILPAHRSIRDFVRSRAARRDGRCRSCGYDLRATPDRCPECGTPTAPASR